VTYITTTKHEFDNMWVADHFGLGST